MSTLITNKFAIYNSYKFFKAKTQDEKQALIRELSQTSQGYQLLEILIPKSEFLPYVPRCTLNLSSLEFEQGGLIMTNSKLILPPGHTRVTKPGYEEVVIPSAQSRIPKGIITQEQIPSFCKPAFNVKALNEIQSTVFPTAFNSDINMLVCAPTGAGKTNIALMTILRLLSRHLKDNGDIDVNHFKIVYIAPMKALVSEICGNLNFRLASYGISVRELTGDTAISKHQIHTTQIIVTTPEK